MNYRLQGWKTKFLNLAGRTTLIQSVLNSIPTHVMQLNILPRKTQTYIDRIQRNFLWGSNQQKHKLHLLSWDTVTYPKKFGRLGIPKTYPKNIALLSSLAWRFHQLPTTLWSATLRGKYHSIRAIIGRNLSTTMKDSYVWKSIHKGNILCQNGTTWNISNGQ